MKLITKAIASVTKLLGLKEENVELVQDDTSQPYALKTRLETFGVKHDQHAVVDLKDVRIVRNRDGQRVLRFCPVTQVDINEVTSKGDEIEIPSQVVLKGMKIPKNMAMGTYELKNVMIHCNGVITISPTYSTKWELVEVD